jgi:Na+/H+ antiporter NhaD/arsenite permease-like protein
VRDCPFSGYFQGWINADFADLLDQVFALGACLGGNFALVGAAANVVVANLAENSGFPIRFRLFLRYGLIVAFFTDFSQYSSMAALSHLKHE